jgi:hypothetical protein
MRFLSALCISHLLIAILLGQDAAKSAARSQLYGCDLRARRAGSYLSSGDRRVRFGIGGESMVQNVEIRWPSGNVQKLENVQGDQRVQVDEPTAGQSEKAIKR